MTRDLYLVPPGHGEPASPGPVPRCPICASVVDPHPASLRVGTAGTCQTHGFVVAVYGRRDEILSRASREPDGREAS